MLLPKLGLRNALHSLQHTLTNAGVELSLRLRIQPPCAPRPLRLKSLLAANLHAPPKYLRLKLLKGVQAAKVPMAITARKIRTRSLPITFTG